MNETEKQIKELKDKIEELENWKKSLESSHSIPLNIDQSFKKRFGGTFGMVVSSKGSTSENQSVNEGGAATYSVLKAPDGFLQTTIGATIYYIPIFT